MISSLMLTPDNKMTTTDNNTISPTSGASMGKDTTTPSRLVRLLII